MAHDIARVVRRTVDETVWLAVEGELEIASVPLLQEAVEAALDAGEREIVVDVGRTEMIDSMGLSGLLAVVRDAALREAIVRVHAPHGHEARVLIELTGVASTLNLIPRD